MPILIVPGLHGSERDHWQSHWERELPDAYRVIQTDWSRPSLDEWLARLADEAQRRPGSVLVGHSLGATLIAHLGQRHPVLEIAGALLVAPADPTRTDAPGVRAFAPVPTGRLTFPATVVASRTDPYMPFLDAQRLAALWGAAFVDAGAAGHINVASGHGRWPEGRLWLQALRGEAEGLAPPVPAQGVVIAMPRRPVPRRLTTVGAV